MPITIHLNISLCGADMMGIVSLLPAFFNSFSLEKDFFFYNFRIESTVHNRKKSDEAKQYSFSDQANRRDSIGT